jgi:RNA polymerase sigma-B factor
MTASPAPHRPPRSPHLSPHPQRRRPPGQPTSLACRNGRWLAAYAASADEVARLHWRNRVVEANLGLVHSVAARFRGISQLPYSDLVQVGCQGLIRAVEAYDSRRGRCLSTFAVPYVRGAIQHEIRDREAWIRAPRPVWDLRQRAKGLLERRRVDGLPPLGRQGLATALGCTLQELDEAEILRRLGTPLSLDAAQSQTIEGDGRGTWLDQLADPRSLPKEDAPPADGERWAQGVWLQNQLRAMDPLQRELLRGRLLLDCTWVELGQQLGLHPRMAERRCNAALRQLRTRAMTWRHGLPPDPLRRPPATTEPDPWPAEPPQGSAGH